MKQNLLPKHLWSAPVFSWVYVGKSLKTFVVFCILSLVWLPFSIFKSWLMSLNVPLLSVVFFWLFLFHIFKLLQTCDSLKLGILYKHLSIVEDYFMSFICCLFSFCSCCWIAVSKKYVAFYTYCKGVCK